MGDRARGGQRVRRNLNMLRPFRVGGDTHGIKDILSWHTILYGGGGNIHGIRKKKFYHGIRPFRVGKGAFMESGRGIVLGVPPKYREARGGERGRQAFLHGIQSFTVGRETLMESGRKKNIMGYDPLGWGGNIHGIRKNFIMGYDPLGWGGGDTHGIRKEKNYAGIRPFRVGGGIHGIRKRKFYHGTREGVALGAPPV